MALAWLMARPGISAPIASATSLEQLQDLVAATQITLSPPEISRLSEVSA
ncbi:MAG TPA: aldo/keto reductase [Enterovirga sp.]|nr:aldo/keto reductase [Enterovirga sp.]